MAEQKITPERITRPIQLLAAWLTGLVLIDGSFLSAASVISVPSWVPGSLVIAAILNVPIFLGAIFLLQTRFRPEMQEDKYYSRYLERKYSPNVEPLAPIDVTEYSRSLAEHLINQIGPSLSDQGGQLQRVIEKSKFEELVQRVGKSRSLSELFLRPHLWPYLVEKWEADSAFGDDLMNLRIEGVVSADERHFGSVTLTGLGRNVANLAKEKGVLWQQNNTDFWEAEGDFFNKKKS